MCTKLLIESIRARARNGAGNRAREQSGTREHREPPRRIRLSGRARTAPPPPRSSANRASDPNVQYQGPRCRCARCLMWTFVLASVAWSARVSAASADLDSLDALAKLDFAQLASSALQRGSDDPVPFVDMPAQFSSAIVLSQTSGTWNQTFAGTIWGSTPTKQQRLSGTQVITNGLQTVKQGVTYIEDGSIGMKYTYTPNPNAKDHGMPDVLCKSQTMTQTELARYNSYNHTGVSDPTMFAGNVFLDDRVTAAFLDPTVVAPGISVLFLDPFKNVPAGMVTKGPRGINTTVLIYEGLEANALSRTEFSVPHGITCTPGEVMSLSTISAWLM